MGVSHEPVVEKPATSLAAGSISAERTSELLKSALAPPASDTPPSLSHNKSTISLEKYRERKPIPPPDHRPPKPAAAALPPPLDLGLNQSPIKKVKQEGLASTVPKSANMALPASGLPALKIKLSSPVPGGPPQTEADVASPLKMVISKDQYKSHKEHKKHKHHHRDGREGHHSKKRSHHSREVGADGLPVKKVKVDPSLVKVEATAANGGLMGAPVQGLAGTSAQSSSLNPIDVAAAQRRYDTIINNQKKTLGKNSSSSAKYHK